MKKTPLLIPLMVAALVACDRPAPKVEPEFGAKVRAYLLENPEVLEEAFQRLEANRKGEMLEANRAALERDSRDHVVNPKGKLTVVEFFDYNCGYCKVIAPHVADLARENPDVRFVFKDMTIFGPTSEYAAAATRQVKGQKFLALHQALMAAKPLEDADVAQLLRRHGGDPDEARRTIGSQAQQDYIADVHALAQALGIQGTPAFVVGDHMIPGADPDALKQAIEAARKG